MEKYRVYGLPNCQMGVSTPLRSSTSALDTPPVISVKMARTVESVIDLFDSANEDVPMQKVVVHHSTPLFPFVFYVTPSPSHSMPLIPSVPFTSKSSQTIVQCLRRLGSMPSSKNVLKKID